MAKPHVPPTVAFLVVLQRAVGCSDANMRTVAIGRDYRELSDNYAEQANKEALEMFGPTDNWEGDPQGLEEAYAQNNGIAHAIGQGFDYGLSGDLEWCVEYWTSESLPPWLSVALAA